MLLILTFLAVGAVGVVGLWVTGLWIVPIGLFAIIMSHFQAFIAIMLIYVAWDYRWQKRAREHNARMHANDDPCEPGTGKPMTLPAPPATPPTLDARSYEERCAAYLARVDGWRAAGGRQMPLPHWWRR